MGGATLVTASFSLLALVAVFTLALFLGSLNLLIWRVQSLDRTPIWLAAWLAAGAVFAFFRILQYVQLSEAAYIVIPRIILTASYILAWMGYKIGNSFIGLRPPRWERNLINFLVVGVLTFLWASNLIFTNQVIVRTIPYGGTPHGTATGALFIPVNLLMLGLALLPALRLFRSSVPSRRENLLMGLGFLFVVLFNLNDIITIALNAHWVRLSDFSYLPVAIFFSYIQGSEFGLLYRDISDMVDERTAELSERTQRCASEHKFSTAFRTSPIRSISTACRMAVCGDQRWLYCHDRLHSPGSKRQNLCRA
jgi:hypothetical protein